MISVDLNTWLSHPCSKFLKVLKVDSLKHMIACCGCLALRKVAKRYFPVRVLVLGAKGRGNKNSVAIFLFLQDIQF